MFDYETNDMNVILRKQEYPCIGDLLLICCLFRIMEVLVVNAQEHLSSLVPSNGLSLLHFAVVHNHTRVCSLLAAEVNML